MFEFQGGRGGQKTLPSVGGVVDFFWNNPIHTTATAYLSCLYIYNCDDLLSISIFIPTVLVYDFSYIYSVISTITNV